MTPEEAITAAERLREKLLRIANVIYIAVEKPVADDISSTLKETAETLDTLRAALLQSQEAQGWQPMETAPKDGPFLVTWAPSKMGGRKPVVEMVGGLHEYEECRSYGEPEAYGWHPLPRALVSPMTALLSTPLAPQEPKESGS